MIYKIKKCIKHLIYAVLSLLSVFVFVPIVSARTKTENWWTNIDSQFIDFFIFSCNSSSGSGCSGSSSPQEGTSGFIFPYSANSSNTQDFGKNGIFSNSISGYADLSFVGFTGDRMKKGNAYSMQFYMCTNFGFPGDREKIKFVLNGGTTAYNALDSTSRYSYQNTNISYLSDMPSSNTPTGSYTDCVMASSIVVPTDDLQWFNWELYNKGINFDNARFYIFGLSINDLGISSNEIENIVKNSGFATASSVEEVKTATDEIKNESKKTNDTINDDDTSGASSNANSFFNDFEENNHGLSGVISAPLIYIKSLLSSTCTPISLTFPFVENYTLTLPCMSSFYTENFGAFFTIYQTIVTGLITYWVCIKIFFMIKGFQNPESDKVEVINL